MKNKHDMYINYDRYYKKRGRKAPKWYFVVFVLLLAIAIGYATFYIIKLRINTKDHNRSDNLSVDEITSEKEVDKNLSQESEDLLLTAQKDQIGAEATVIPTPTQEPKEEVDEVVDTRTPVKVKGIYVTSSYAGSSLVDSLIELADTTEVNAMVIDIKDDQGRITYHMKDTLAEEIGATTNTISDIETFIASLKEKNIYLIARIVAFKDPFLAEKRQDMAIKNGDGSIFRDNNGEGWVNPYNHEVWDYLIETAAQAASIGFDEIQFDYIRFSTGEGIKKADFGEEAKTKSKEDIIIEFTKYAYESLKPLGVYVSADVYGTIISSSIDAGLVGQNYVEMSKYLDYICPMIYPSHFGEGNYGIEHPDLEPRNIIRKVLIASKEKLNQIPEEEHKAIVRPWLQDFTATWIEHYMEYGGEEIREQIDGVYDAGYEEWLLWNASCNYSEEGLLAE